MSNWKSYVVPPVFLAAMVYTKGIFGDGQLPDSPVLIADVVANVVGYEVAKLVSEKVIDGLMTSKIMQEGSDRVIEPLIQGVVNAAIPHVALDTVVLAKTSAVSDVRKARVLPVAGKTFGDRFADGVLFNVASTYLAEPLTN